jgi:hypothetical protein
VPYHFEFDATNRILRCRFDGRVTDEALKECYRLAAEYVAQADPRAAIIDLSAVTSFEVSAETIRELARSAPVMPDPIRPRCVVAPSPKIFGLMRMFEIEGEVTHPNLHVVRTPEEAWAILGVQGSKFKPLLRK